MADTGFTGIDLAKPLAGTAPDSGVREFFIEQCRMHGYLPYSS